MTKSHENGAATGYSVSHPGRRGLGVALLAGTACLMLAGCAEREVLLTGKREVPYAVMQDRVPSDTPQQPVNQVRPVSLPAVTHNANWTEGPGSPETRVGNAALSADPKLIWSADIGEADNRKAHITASPVVADGRIFAMDAGSTVTATSAGGKTLWKVSLRPEREKKGEASGGGLAYGDGKLFVTSGYGILTALDPSTGKQIWQQKLLATASAAPVVHDGIVYAISGNDTGWAIDAGDGRVLWQVSAPTTIDNWADSPSPAVSSKYAVFGFGSGEVESTFRRSGMHVWSTFVTGRRIGYAMSNVEGITGDPLIDGDTLFTGSGSGRSVAVDITNGDRIWTAKQGPMGPMWPAGNSIFMVNDQNQLVRLEEKTGDQVWSVDLPLFIGTKPKKQDAMYAHYGPIMANGRLVVASSDGKLRFFAPQSGDLLQEIALPGGAASAPVVAGGTLYVVSRDGKLLAYR